MSSFTWLDYSEHDQRQMYNVIHLFAEKGTRDELGIGTVRDAFADLLFPGTSTIQTRARYFLFIPWIYLDLEGRGYSSSDFEAKAREKEVALINHLIGSGETRGVIGINARHNLKRLPSSIYWQGLAEWGIRRFPGFQDQYRRTLNDFNEANHQVRHDNQENDRCESLHHNWDPGLPSKPHGFPRNVTFKLRPEEAEYLRERILRHAPNTLLAFLVDRSQPTERTDFPWQHPQFGEFPDHIREQLEHGRNFSELIRGAALVYNLMLAERARQVRSESWQEKVDDYRKRLRSWADKLIRPERKNVLDRWDWRSRFWEIVMTVNPSIPHRTKTFINRWLELALLPEVVNSIADNEQARGLISHRERLLKGSLARLFNPRALELWSGESGTWQLDYRWGGVQTIIADIIEGHESAEAPEDIHA